MDDIRQILLKSKVGYFATAMPRDIIQNVQKNSPARQEKHTNKKRAQHTVRRQLYSQQQQKILWHKGVQQKSVTEGGPWSQTQMPWPPPEFASKHHIQNPLRQV